MLRMPGADARREECWEFSVGEDGTGLLVRLRVRDIQRNSQGALRLG